MTPAAFGEYVRSLVERNGFPPDRLVLGADHLGPGPWQKEPAATAMQNSIELVHACVQAGYTKLHLDAIVTPTTACTAPRIPPDALPAGESDLTALLEIMRFAPSANFTGLPAISFPAGYDSNGLPIGFQAIGQAWHEHVLLRIAHVAEGLVERRTLKVLFDLLPER